MMLKAVMMIKRLQTFDRITSYPYGASTGM